MILIVLKSFELLAVTFYYLSLVIVIFVIKETIEMEKPYVSLDQKW